MKNDIVAEDSAQLKEISSIDLRIFESMPGNSALLLPDAPRYTILAATPRYLLDALRTKEDVVGKGVFEAFPPNPKEQEFTGEKNLSVSFQAVIVNKREHSLPVQRYDIPNSDGTFTERYWKTSNRPVLADDGTVCYIIHTAEEITNEVNAQQREKAIKGIEQAYELFMQAPVSIHMIKGYNLIIDMANAPALQYWGRGTEVVGKPLMEALPELEEQGYDEFLREVLRTGQTKEFYEAPVTLQRNGKKEVSYFNFIYKPYYEEGNPEAVGIVTVSTEVTDKVLSKKELQESEARFRSLIEEAPVATCLFVGRELIIEIANERMIEIWGKGNTVFGKPLAQALPELEEQHFLPLLDELFTTGRIYEAKGGRADLEVDSVLKTFYFDYSFKPVRNAAGEIYAILEMAQDVTEQVLYRKKLEESRQNLRNIILKAPVAMCILRQPEYVVEIANERMLELWGKPAEDVMNKPIFEGLREAREQGLEVLLRNVYTTGETFNAFERPVDLPHDGRIETKYLNFVYEALYESNGVISGIMAVAIDVTEQVVSRLKIEDVVAQRTRELSNANKALQQNNRELEQFAYVTSHDLQEPLRKVSTFTDRLRANLGEMDERTKTYLSKILVSTARMAQLIKDVLNFSQLSAEREVFKPVNLTEVVADIISDFELLIEQKEAIINYNNLPTIEAIPLQMRQLFSNLLSNALKFTKEGVQPVITITAQQLPEEARKKSLDLLPDKPYFFIQVEDNGIGFEQGYSDKIFGIFKRLHDKTEYTGTGIGLALCKKIVQNHHGEIWATSTKNKGSVFHIVLPERSSH